MRSQLFTASWLSSTSPNPSLWPLLIIGHKALTGENCNISPRDRIFERSIEVVLMGKTPAAFAGIDFNSYLPIPLSYFRFSLYGPTQEPIATKTEAHLVE